MDDADENLGVLGIQRGQQGSEEREGARGGERMALDNAVTVRAAGHPCVIYGIREMALRVPKRLNAPHLHSNGVEACSSPTMIGGKPFTDVAISVWQYCTEDDAISSVTFPAFNVPSISSVTQSWTWSPPLDRCPDLDDEKSNDLQRTTYYVRRGLGPT